MKRYLGVAWYPELWPESVWRDDLEKMALAGVNLCRVGEFAWSALEPHEGELKPEALRPAVEMAIAHGMDVVMCTPTPTPPIWLTHGHPERMHVDLSGRQMVHGGRQQACFGQPDFNRYAERITSAVADVYADMPGVVAWQLDNELMGNVAECTCGDCTRRWAGWLEKTYQSITALNDAWGTGVWSQSYETFWQVPVPLYSPAGQNPALVTAYRLFQQHEAAAFIRRQAALIRERTNRPITLNSSLNHYIDHPDTFASLDFASFDHYSHSTEPHKMRFFMDVFKTLKPKNPWWLMETSPSWSGCWVGHQPMHETGYLSVEAAQAWAMGAQCVALWLWRQQRAGSEMEHGSVLHSWGAATPGFEEVTRSAALLKRLQPILDKSEPSSSDIALMWSDRARAFFRTEPLEGESADYGKNIGFWHRLLLKAGLYAEGVFPDNELEHHQVLLTPCLPHIPEEVTVRGRNLMARGGTWICGPLAGHRTAEHTVPLQHALGRFGEEMALPEMTVVPLTGSGTRGAAFGKTAPLGWYAAVATGAEGAFLDSAFVTEKPCNAMELLQQHASNGAEWTMLGRVVGGPASGLPFVLERSVGPGKLVLVGAMPQGEEGEEMILAMLARYAKPSAPLNLPEGVTAIPRERHDGWGRLWVLVNLTSEAKRWKPEQKMRELLDNKIVEPTEGLFFRPFDVKVVEAQFA